MAPRKDDGGRLYVAKSNFAVTINGAPVVVKPGDLVREGHPLLKGRMSLFDDYTPQVRFERA